MRAGEFLKRLKALGRDHDVSVSYDPRKGKGSPGTVYYGERSTTLKDLNKDISPGLLSDMLNDLGLSKKDFWG